MQFVVLTLRASFTTTQRVHDLVMSGKGVKRASPGADERKNPLGDVELSDEDAKKLQEVQKSIARTELILGPSPPSRHASRRR